MPDQSQLFTKSFFDLLVSSGCVGEGTGWDPHFFMDEDQSFSYLFSKNHSYGEYIFDWAWAQAFEQYGRLYYPKLTSMIPFSPITTNHFYSNYNLSEVRAHHLTKHLSHYMNNNYSSLHYLFITKDEVDFFSEQDFMIRHSFQYHFTNDGYHDFEDFLSHLKSRKAKQLRKERVFPDSIRIESLTGSELTSGHAQEMWSFYLSTIQYKGAIPYLNQAFFEKLFSDMRKNVLFVRASEGATAVAGSLFLYDDHNLYGRYWGCLREIKGLHFELCYYQGIDFCIDKKIKNFEAGAQGEHKIARGFKPTLTYSAHHIKDEQFRMAINDFIRRERMAIKGHLDELQKGLPFR